LPGVAKVFTPPLLIEGFLGFAGFVTEAPSRLHFSFVWPPLTFLPRCREVFAPIERRVQATCARGLPPKRNLAGPSYQVWLAPENCYNRLG
jgi:hypothetical protein